MYGKNTVYIKYCDVCLNIDYILRCLEYMCSVSSPFGYLIVKTLTNIR